MEWRPEAGRSRPERAASLWLCRLFYGQRPKSFRRLHRQTTTRRADPGRRSRQRAWVWLPMKTQNYRSNNSGGGLVVVIILIMVVGGGLWYLVSHKQSMDKEGRAFGHEAINRIVLNYDIAFLSNNLSPQAKLDLPQSEQNALMNQL